MKLTIEFEIPDGSDVIEAEEYLRELVDFDELQTELSEYMEASLEAEEF